MTTCSLELHVIGVNFVVAVHGHTVAVRVCKLNCVFETVVRQYILQVAL